MNEEEQASQEESQGTEEQEKNSTEDSSTEKNSDKGETNNSPDGDNDEPTPSDNTDGDGSEYSDNGSDNENSDGEDTAGTGSADASTEYDPELMLESHNRKLLYNKFVALRDILWDISNMADDLLGKYENTNSPDTTVFTTWKNASYISNTAQEKIEQISSILRSDVITKLEVDKLRKIFLALQRITNSLIDLLERATRKN